jgi:hypothetical protein
MARGGGRRWLGPAAAHAVAAPIALFCLVVVPVALFTLAFFGLMAVALITNGDLGGPLFFPFGVILLVALGCASWIAVASLSVVADLLCRWWRCPRWTPPPVVALLAGLAAFGLARDASTGQALFQALLAGGSCAAAFLAYWIPLVLSGAVGRLSARLVRFLGARLRALRARRA